MMDKTADPRALFRAALYAGAVFVRMSKAGVSQHEVDEVLPTMDEPGNITLASNIAWFAMLMKDPASMLQLLEAVHQGKASATEQDLERLSFTLDSLLNSVTHNSDLGIEEIRQITAKHIGLATTEQLRAGALARVWEAVDLPKTNVNAARLIKTLSEYSAEFSTLQPASVREVLERTTAEEKVGGKAPGGKARLAPLGACAQLSVMARAFGDTDVKDAKAAYASAAKKVEEQRLADQRAAQAEVQKRQG